MVTLRLHKPGYALFACWFLFAAPYFYPSHFFPFARVAPGEVHILWSCVILALMIAAAAASGTAGRTAALPRPEGEGLAYWRFVRRSCVAAFIVALAANAVITADAIRSIDTSILEAKGSIEKFGGINILSQVHLLFLGPFIWSSSLLGRRKGRWLAALGLILLLRAVFMSERLAFLEFLVPCIVVACLTGDLRISPARVAAWTALFVLLFVLTELTRSFYVRYVLGARESVDAAFALSWTVERFAAYYADTANKFHFALANDLYGTTQYYLYTLARVAYRLVDSQADVGAHFAAAMTNAHYKDFTNPGGFTVAVTDFGVLWLPFLFLFFAAFSLLHPAFRGGRLFALGLYPIYYVAVLELPRFNYLFLSRFTFAFMVFLLFWLAVRAMVSARAARPRRQFGSEAPAYARADG